MGKQDAPFPRSPSQNVRVRRHPQATLLYGNDVYPGRAEAQFPNDTPVEPLIRCQPKHLGSPLLLLLSVTACLQTLQH